MFQSCVTNASVCFVTLAIVGTQTWPSGFLPALGIQKLVVLDAPQVVHESIFFARVLFPQDSAAFVTSEY